MTVDITVLLAESFCAGLIIGMAYFIGLWWTVRKISSLQAPAAWLLVSFLTRAVVVLVAFYFVMNGGWQNLIACVVGFLTARLLLLRRISPQSATQNRAADET